MNGWEIAAIIIAVLPSWIMMFSKLKEKKESDRALKESRLRQIETALEALIQKDKLPPLKNDSNQKEEK